jgi:hypothetical protein
MSFDLIIQTGNEIAMNTFYSTQVYSHNSFIYIWSIIGFQLRIPPELISVFKQLTYDIQLLNTRCNIILKICSDLCFFKTSYFDDNEDNNQIFQPSSILYNHEMEILYQTYQNIYQHVIPGIKEQVQQYNLQMSIVYSPTSLANQKEGNDINWLNQLFNVYEKYQGQLPVSSLHFFQYYKTIWSQLSDEETIQISNITEYILGGNSIEHLSYNLLHYIKQNSDLLRIVPKLQLIKHV